MPLLRRAAEVRDPARGAEGQSSAIDGRTTRHAGYAVSRKKRKLVEEAFGWAKTNAGCAKIKMRGLARVRHHFTLAMAAYNLIRMPRLLAQARLSAKAGRSANPQGNDFLDPIRKRDPDYP